MFRQLRLHSLKWTRSYTTQIQARLDYTRIAENPQAINENMLNRNHRSVDASHVKSLYDRRLDNYNALSNLRAQRNLLSKRAKNDPEIIQQAKHIKEQIKQLETSLAATETELLQCAIQIPNDTHPDVPLGPESNARVLKTVGNVDALMGEKNACQDHVALATKLGMLDLEQAAIVSGSSFYYLQGYGAFLETALIQYAMDKAASKGFLGVITPDIVRTPIAYGCGFQPRAGESSQIYHVHAHDDDALCLAGTAEIPLAGKFATRVLEEAELPHRLVGYGRAYRAEAGGRGTETKGLYRVHQFSKVELFAVSTSEQSDAVLEEFREIQEEMFAELGLCFRVLDMPTEELGASAYRKYDIEAWMPGRKAWGEISSTSNCTDYQARRLSIRYRPTHKTDKNTLFCHTINGTAIAVPRVIIAILETFQQLDGSVKVPQVLQKWLPGQPSILSPPKHDNSSL